MNYLLSASQMKDCDETTIHEFKVPQLVLMERAALAVADSMKDEEVDLKKILVICGHGNNGADGVALARILWEEERDVTIYMSAGENLQGALKYQLEMAEALQIPIIGNLNENAYTVIVDALFGVGCNRPLTGEPEEIVAYINRQRLAGATVVSVDIPSGIHASTGSVLGTAVKADLTVTFAFYKRGQILYPGADYCGKILVKQIGITRRALKEQENYCRLLQKDDLKLPKREAYSNKGTYGKVLLIAGSQDVGGAALMSAKAAFAAGAGMLKIVTHKNNQEAFLANLPEAMLLTYENDIREEALQQAIRWADIVAIGPGISTSETGKKLLKFSFSYTEGKWILLDADAITIAAEHRDWLKGHQVIMTPHVGEYLRYAKGSKEELFDDFIEQAKLFAIENQVQLILKDTRTVCATSEGDVYVNRFGNSGMAKAGSGDVLFGILSAFVARKIPVKEAMYEAVLLHALCGDRAKEQCGEYGMMATDLIRMIPDILK